MKKLMLGFFAAVLAAPPPPPTPTSGPIDGYHCDVLGDLQCDHANMSHFLQCKTKHDTDSSWQTIQDCGRGRCRDNGNGKARCFPEPPSSTPYPTEFCDKLGDLSCSPDGRLVLICGQYFNWGMTVHPVHDCGTSNSCQCDEVPSPENHYCHCTTPTSSSLPSDTSSAAPTSGGSTLIQVRRDDTSSTATSSKSYVPSRVTHSTSSIPPRATPYPTVSCDQGGRLSCSPEGRFVLLCDEYIAHRHDVLKLTPIHDCGDSNKCQCNSNTETPHCFCPTSISSFLHGNPSGPVTSFQSSVPTQIRRDDLGTQCSRVGERQCNPDKSTVQACVAGLSGLYWRDTTDCGNPGCCQIMVEINIHAVPRCVCQRTLTLRAAVEPTATPPIVAIIEPPIPDRPLRCYVVGDRQCSPDRSEIEECSEDLFWQDVESCGSPDCCYIQTFFPVTPICRCRGTLTTSPPTVPTPSPVRRTVQSETPAPGDRCQRADTYRCSADKKHIEGCTHVNQTTNGQLITHLDWRNSKDCSLPGCKTCHSGFDLDGHLRVRCTCPGDKEPEKHVCDWGAEGCSEDEYDVTTCWGNMWYWERHCPQGQVCRIQPVDSHDPFSKWTPKCIDGEPRYPLRASIQGKPSSDAIARAESDVLSHEVLATGHCNRGDIRCSIDRSKVEICAASHAWETLHECGFNCCIIVNGQLKCQCPTLRPPPSEFEAEQLPNVAVRAERASISSLSSNNGCPEGKQKCHGNELQECRNGEWARVIDCLICYENAPPTPPYCTVDGKLNDVRTVSSEPLDLASVRETTIAPRSKAASPGAPCTGYQMICSSDHKYILKCANGQWKIGVDCRPSGCEMERGWIPRCYAKQDAPNAVARDESVAPLSEIQKEQGDDIVSRSRHHSSHAEADDKFDLDPDRTSCLGRTDSRPKKKDSPWTWCSKDGRKMLACNDIYLPYVKERCYQHGATCKDDGHGLASCVRV